LSKVCFLHTNKYAYVHSQGLSPVIQVRPTQLFVKALAVIRLVRNAIDPIL